MLRYVLRRPGAPAAEYRHGVTGLAVLPASGGWPYLLPRFSAQTEGETFPPAAEYLGHRYIRAALDKGVAAALPEDIRLLRLRPDVLTGVPHNTRQVDETRRYDDSDYEYVALTQDDFAAMIAAGVNCFRAEAGQAAWFEDAGVFYWGVDAGDMAYPECLYQPLYIGPALFLDEPAVVTRDHALRPRLREEEAFRRGITTAEAMAAFEAHYAGVMNEGAPAALITGLAKRDDVDAGDMRFRQASLYTWETMVSSAA